MKKSLVSLLICLSLALVMSISACTGERPNTPQTPATSTKTSSTSVNAGNSSNTQAAPNPGTNSSMEVVDPTISNSAGGTVSPSIQSNANTSASAVNPSSNVGNAGGGTAGTTSVWLPDIYDYDNVTPDYGTSYDDSTKYNYSGISYTAKQGNFSTSGSTYTTTAASTIAVNSSIPFPYGTLSADLVYKGGDSGIIFGYKNTGTATWEGSGIQFYFLFINASGKFYLGKSVNNSWSSLAEKYIGVTDQQHTYNIKAVVVSNKIICLIDNVVAFTYVDSAFLTSTGFGFRAGVSGTAFKNVTVTNDYVFDNDSYSLDNGANYTYPGTLTTVAGGFTVNGSNFVSSAANSLAADTTPFRYGSIQVDIKPSNSSDNGIVFGYSKTGTATWEGSGISYYFLFVNYQGIVILGKSDNGTWSTAGQSSGVVVKDFTKSYKLLLVYKEREINVYLDGTLLFTSLDGDPLFGTGYGLRAGGNGVSFANFTVTSDYLK